MSAEVHETCQASAHLCSPGISPSLAAEACLRFPIPLSDAAFVNSAIPLALSARRADSQQLVRQWALLRLLSDSPDGRGVKNLAEQLGVSKATVQRDLATLERDFAIIEESDGKQKKLYRINEKIRALETVQFGSSELLAIYASLAALSELAGTPLHEDLKSVSLKLRGFLSPAHNGGLEALVSVFSPHARGYVDYAGHHDLIDQLGDAIARKRICKLSYYAAWKATTKNHVIRPLRLVWHRSALYLLACLGDHTRITTFAVQRIRGLEMTRDVFSAPKIDIDAHISKAFGIFVSDKEQDVEIRFSPDVAWRIEERTFHPDEQKARTDDGTLHYKLRSSAQWEIVPWVQSFGPNAELIAPASWRECLRQNLTAAAEKYATPAATRV